MLGIIIINIEIVHEVHKKKAKKKQITLYWRTVSIVSSLLAILHMVWYCMQSSIVIIIIIVDI